MSGNPEVGPSKQKKIWGKLIKPADLLLVLFLVAVSVAALFLIPRGGDVVEVTLGGKTVWKGSLTEEKTIFVEGKYHNTVCVGEGSVWVEDSDCPGEDCVHMGKISGGQIACAPNGMLVRILTEGEGGADIVAE